MMGMQNNLRLCHHINAAILKGISKLLHEHKMQPIKRDYLTKSFSSSGTKCLLRILDFGFKSHKAIFFFFRFIKGIPLPITRKGS